MPVLYLLPTSSLYKIDECMTADAHFGARLGAFFIEPDVLKTTYRSTIPLQFIWSICSGNYG